jgi:hypothetical protein
MMLVRPGQARLQAGMAGAATNKQQLSQISTAWWCDGPPRRPASPPGRRPPPPDL